MPGEPAVTVLLAVHNDRQYLPAAVESVLAQSFADLEFLIIDDGSTDGASDYLKLLRDRRVRLIHNGENLGLTRSLNIGLDQCRGKYIARMDADDICHVDRLARQVRFLDDHPAVGIVGTSRQLMDADGIDAAVAHATVGDLQIRRKCLLGNPFAHPSVMLRRSVLDAHHLRYDPSFRTAQDYELWTRLLAVCRGENLDEPLLRYRLRDGISRLSKIEQLANHDRIALAAIQRLAGGFAITPMQVRELRGRFGGHSVRDEAMDASEPKWVELHKALLAAVTR